MEADQLLQAFESISLDDTNASASLLRRVDTKYVIRPDQLSDVLMQWRHTHRILEIEGRRIFHYHSVYYDTPSFSLYHAHHAGAGKRFKFRVREYTDSQRSYYEIKERINTGITNKHRTRILRSEQLTELLKNAPLLQSQRLGEERMEDVLQVDYDRITLVDKQGKERITIDSNLTYGNRSQKIAYPDRVIIEVKHERSVRSRQRDLFRRLGIRPGSVSKYCLGVMSLYPQVKKNRFKLPLRILSKQLEQHGATTNAS